MVRTYSADDARHQPNPEVQLAARDAIQGRTHGLRAILPFLGPAFIASIAYTDPGNFATNISAGGQVCSAPPWVLLLSHPMAVVLQGVADEAGRRTGMKPAAVVPAGVSPALCFRMCPV